MGKDVGLSKAAIRKLKKRHLRLFLSRIEQVESVIQYFRSLLEEGARDEKQRRTVLMRGEEQAPAKNHALENTTAAASHLALEPSALCGRYERAPPPLSTTQTP